MKKLVAILSFLLLAVFMVACGDTDTPPTEDPAQAKLDATYNTLSGIIKDPSNITATFVVISESANGSKIEWTSSEPSVLSFGTATNGQINVTVNRPDAGSGDATVKITAVVKIKSELDETKTLQKTWEINVVVKQKEPDPGLPAINTIGDLLAAKDDGYLKLGEITFENVSIFSRGSDAAFGYDGTGTIHLVEFKTVLEVGKVYTVTGTVDFYFGVWRLKSGTAELQAGATLQAPEKQVIESVTDLIADLTAQGTHQYTSSPKDGNFEAIYATITAKVYVDLEDPTNYNTFLIDTQDSEVIQGAVATGLMLYYKTDDFGYVKQFNGIEVTMDVVIHTFRSNNLAFAFYYVGGPSGIEASMTDEQIVEASLEALNPTIPVLVDGQEISLPTVGAENATITWAFKNAADANKDLVNLETGVVNMGASNVSVVLVATVTKGAVSNTKEITVVIGYEHRTIAEFLDASDKATKEVQITGVVVGSLATGATGTQSYVIADASGSTTVRVPHEFRGEVEVGKTITLVGKYNIYNGLHQVDYVICIVQTGDGDVPNPVDVTGTATTAIVQSQLVQLTELAVTAVSADTYGNTTITFAGDQGFKVRWDVRVELSEELKAAFEALKVGDVVTITALTQASTTQFSLFAGSVIVVK